MSSPQTTTKNPIAPERLAEAGVWIARLHGGNRTRAVENGLKRWLRADTENARAFELATEVWDDAENLRQFLPLKPKFLQRPRSSMAPIFASAAMATVLLVLGAVLWFQNLGVIATGVGEQRQVVLEDGTRIILNTDTRLVVSYKDDARRVELRRGEALFNVAKRPDWPFIVTAGDRQVRALGTSFVVRKEDQQLAVMLVEGKVVVSPVVEDQRSAAEPALAQQPAQSTGSAAPSVDTQTSAPARSDVFTLAPGQRLTFGAGSPAKLDTPSVEKATAWRRGQVILDDTPLRAAADEMNRYNATKLVIADNVPGDVLVSGLFQAGDSMHFANAVAHTYKLNVQERGAEIILSSSAPH
jgi:transmembrane sensor